MNAGLSVLTAVLLILVFPRFNFTWFAPVALTPLLIACARVTSWKRRFLLGWLAGFVYWFGVCYWIQFVLEVHGGMGRWGGWGTFLLFAVLKGLHLAIFSALVGLVMPRWWAIPAAAALWTGIERTHGPLGFAWLDLGNAGLTMPLPMRLAPVTGVYGLSFLFAMLGCAVALVALRRPRRELSWLVVIPLLLLLPALPSPAAGTEPVRVVQPNIDTEASWTTSSLATLETQMAMLSRAPGVPLIVWPEAPAPFYLSDADFRTLIGQVTQDSQATLIFNGVARSVDGHPLNSAFFVRPDGSVADRYDQIKLVPFGEYVPPIFSWVTRISQEAGELDFVQGSRVVTQQIGERRMGVFICYESAFPDLVRQFVRNGADALINLSNDGYFGASAAHEQHVQIARMRAAENKRWILRATNDGITAMIDPAGRVTDRLPSYVAVASTMRYNYLRDVTPYTRFGDWFAWSCLVLGLSACLRRLAGPA